MLTKLFNGKIISEGFSGNEIFIKDGKFVSDPLPGELIDEEIDLKGSYVSAGFIDSHVHVFEDMTDLGVDPDDIGIRQGVSTVIDAGSTGIDNFEEFKENIMDKSKTNVFSLINFSRIGLVTGGHELCDLNNLSSYDEIKAVMDKYPGKIVGIKTRMSSSIVGDNGSIPLQRAEDVSQELDVPIMIHIGNPPLILDEIFPLMKKGDIVTHAFNGKKPNTIIDDEGQVIASAKDAIQRGVKFDVGHGSASFSFKIFEQFLKQTDKTNYSCSTDLHQRNIYGPVQSLMLTLSKLYSYDVPLEYLVKAVTSVPAENFHLTSKGKIAEGFDADVTVFTVEKEDLEVVDSMKEKRTLHNIIKPKMTFVNGILEWESEK